VYFNSTTSLWAIKLLADFYHTAFCHELNLFCIQFTWAIYKQTIESIHYAKKIIPLFQYGCFSKADLSENKVKQNKTKQKVVLDGMYRD